ncbi:BhlA/UviB family holin-like peptide [Bacillus sp. 03113]|uniref:BhlA/UviB family holin-like peptide n=1 Tax=Bacillus sp. 03113 TaxID=2578211 RepID=UPI00114322D5|nr:BhlA/UviB family holin-like peptide [Bacillus sp. 03113]
MELDYQYFLTQGPFAVLFVWLFMSTRKETKEREARLYETIDQQNEVIEQQNEVLGKFSDKYDVVIEKLDKIESKIG